MATVGPAMFQFVDKDGDGSLTVDEIIDAMGQKKLVEFVKGVKCPVLLRLFQEEESLMRKAFKQIDKDNSGHIDEDEWMNFLYGVQVKE